MTWINDDDVVGNFAEMSATITREQELAYLQSMIHSDHDRLLAIEDEGGEILGNAGIHKIYWPARNGRVGVVIGRRDRQGGGLGQQVLKLLAMYAFESLMLHKLWIVHFSSNLRMAHMCQKLGFQREGLLRDEYFHRGAWHDMVRCSMLDSDYARVDWRSAGG